MKAFANMWLENIANLSQRNVVNIALFDTHQFVVNARIKFNKQLYIELKAQDKFDSCKQSIILPRCMLISNASCINFSAR